MKHTILFAGAVLLLALLAAGCLVNNQTAPPVLVQNTTAPSVDAQARSSALKAELESLLNELQASQSRLVQAEQTNDWDGLIKESKTSNNLLAQMYPKSEEACRLQKKDCTADLASIQQTLFCMNRTLPLFDDMRTFATGTQDLRACAQRCPDLSETCTARCNAILRDLKQICTQLRAKTPDVRQACAGPSSASMAQGLDGLDKACREVAASPYLRADTRNLTEEPAPDLQILPNSSNTGPEITGAAVLDPNKGAFITKSCTISATPDVIFVGQETKILFRAYAGSGERITYTCGNGDPRSNGNGGLIDTFRICRYDSEGPTTIWVALDGYVCASALLDVDPHTSVSDSPSCRIAANTQTTVREGAGQTYSASVRFRHQPSSAILRWNCGGETFTKRLSDLVSGDSLDGAALVSCAFGGYSARDTPGRIYIDELDCGSMAAEGG